MSSSLGLVGAAEAALATGASGNGWVLGLRSQRIAPMPARRTRRTTAYLALLDLGAGGGRLEGVVISGGAQWEGGSAPALGEGCSSIAVL